MSRHLARLSVEVVLVPAHAVTQVLVEVDRLACLIDALTSPHHGHDLRPPVDPEDG